MKSRAPLLLLGGLGALGVLVVAASGGRKRTAARLMHHAATWVDRVIARVAQHEGGYDSLNLNRDGAGLSFGILQWAQKPGDLGVLLAAMHRADPAAFRRIFGPDVLQLLQVTATGSLAPVAGAVLWQDPWPTRFREAGRLPAYQAIQRRLATQGRHFREAIAAARVLGVATERSLALLFDTAVQQWQGAAEQIARQVKRHYLDQGRTSVPYTDLLHTYARMASQRFRRTTPPTAPFPASHIEWRKTGNEWHAWAGSVDLYANILHRRTSIATDPSLSDTPLEIA